MLLVSVLQEVSAVLCCCLFILLVMKRGSGLDRIKSSWSLCCSHSRSSQRIWSALYCAGVWLFWAASANSGCFWPGCTWGIAINAGKMFCAALQGMKLLISATSLPRSLLSWWQAHPFKQIWSLLSHLINKSAQIRSLPPPVAPSFPAVGGECLWSSPFPDAGCEGLSWHPGSRDRFLFLTASVWMNHHAVLLNHLCRRMKVMLVPLVVVLGNGDETENVGNIKTVLFNGLAHWGVEGYQEILELLAGLGFVIGGLPWTRLSPLILLWSQWQRAGVNAGDLVCLTWFQALCIWVQALWERGYMETPVRLYWRFPCL